MARVSGQGYCRLEDVTDELSAETGANGEVQARIPGWIAKFSDYMDDRIRGCYVPPFPDAPNAPGLLRMACAYYVIHQVFVYNGMVGVADDESGRASYYTRAESLVAKVVSGEAQLDTDYPGLGPDGSTLIVPITNRPRYADHGTNPMSLANQEREFGPAVKSNTASNPWSPRQQDSNL